MRVIGIEKSWEEKEEEIVESEDMGEGRIL